MQRRLRRVAAFTKETNNIQSHDFKSNYLFEGVADSVIDPDDIMGNGWEALPEEEVCRKDADEREVLLTTQAHDCERSLDALSEVLVLRVLHASNLLGMLSQGPHQLVLIPTALCHVGLHSCGHFRRHTSTPCSTTKRPVSAMVN